MLIKRRGIFMQKRYLMVWALLVCFLIAGCGSNSGVVATVNGKEITQKEYDQRNNIIKAGYQLQQGVTLDEKKDADTLKKIRDMAYNDLVVQKLLDEEAAKKGIKVTDKEVEDNINYLKTSRNQSESDGYDKFLKQMGITQKELPAILKEELIYSKMNEKITADIVVADQDVKDYYDQNQQMFEQQAGIEIYHILVKKEAAAKEVLNKLKAGGDWNKLAAEYSIDEASKNQGGDIGVVNEGSDLVEEFKTAALKLKPGEITQAPVKSQYGYHIIKAGENKAASVTPFEQVKDSIKSQLETDKKDQAFSKYIDGLKKKAEIKDLRDKK
jgi:parvulin-like peptidyl-prolyl isomerase